MNAIDDATAKEIEAIYPLAPAQHGMLYHSMLAPRSGVYVPQCAIELAGTVDAAALRTAWEGVVARHAVFRTAFVRLREERPLQVVLKSAPLPYRELDWRANPAKVDDFERLLHDEWTEPFEYFRPPLMRLVLVRWDEARYRLVWTHHHALSDGWSTPIVLRELFAIYSAVVGDGAIHLPAPVPYRAYLRWLSQRDARDTERFWADYLCGSSGGTPVPFSSQVRAEAHREATKNDVEWMADRELSSALRAAARECCVTLNVAVQAAWALLLARMNGVEDVTFGATVAGRPPEIDGVAGIVGQFVNTVPVRVKLDASQTLSDWLRSLQAAQAERDPHSYPSLVDIKRAAGIPATTAPFHSLVVFENYPLEGGAEALCAGGLQARLLRVVSQNNYPLSLVVFPDQRLRIKFKYDATCLRRREVTALAERFGEALRALCGSPERLVGDLSLVGGEERAELSSRWSAQEYGAGKSIVDAFGEMVKRGGGNVALSGVTGRVSYLELDARSNRVGRYLRSLGVKRGEGVGIVLGRESRQLESVLGVLKSGCWYVPLDAGWPSSRIKQVLDSSGVGYAVCAGMGAERLYESGWEGEVVDWDRDEAELGEESGAALDVGVDPEDVAYVIYTSGSTGEPKGVVVSHGSVVSYARGVVGRLGVGAGSSYGWLSTVGADLGYTAIYGALLTGGTLRLLEERLSLDALGLREELEREGLTVLKVVPSHLRALLEGSGDGGWLPEVLVLGGERLDWDLVERVKLLRPSCRVFNHYGPTETTVGVLCGEVKGGRATEGVPLGEVLPGAEVRVLDGRLEPVVLGGEGELYIGGRCVSQGYLGKGGQTAHRYVAADGGGRLYRTGDRVRVGLDGSLYFQGRRDEQVKVRGYRVEPNEIAEVLRSAPGVRDAVVLCDEGRLRAYVAGPAETSLRTWLLERLPEHMCPERIDELERLPLTLNGKVDREALRGLKTESGAPEAEAPRTETERRLWQIWSDLLRRADFGIHENFFDCGGNSLSLIQAHAVTRERCGCGLEVVDLFHYPTIAALAAFIDEKSIEATPPQRPSSDRSLGTALQ